MHTKLTLRLDQDLIEKTKKIAKAQHLSLSEMVAQYFKFISGSYSGEISSPVLSEISGILSGKHSPKTLLDSYKQHIKRKYR